MSDLNPREMTARQLAELLLAMPDPDSVLSATVLGAANEELHTEIVWFDVRQGMDTGYFLKEPSAAHWVDLVLKLEPR